MDDLEKVSCQPCQRSTGLKPLNVQGTINTRINILYFLDSLCETCLLVKSKSAHKERSSSSRRSTNLYVDFVSRDLDKIVEHVVPQGRQGLPNLVSTKQVR